MKIYEIIEKIVNVLLKILAYVATFLLAFMFIFNREYINSISTNELIIICTLIIMGYTIPD